MYLGSSPTFPIIDEKVFHRDLTCDRSGDAPWQKVLASEQHVVTTVLNRVNYETLNSIRTQGNPAPAAYSVTPGKLVLNSTDFSLFVRYAMPNVVGGPPLAPPAGTAKGRLYYSAVLEASRLAQPKRVQELGLVIECNQLWDNANRKWLFWSELDADLPLAEVPE